MSADSYVDGGKCGVAAFSVDSQCDIIVDIEIEELAPVQRGPGNIATMNGYTPTQVTCLTFVASCLGK